jgi:hypothetical protein
MALPRGEAQIAYAHRYATFRLANGTLVISATFKGNKPPAGPVIGGTGTYEGASGAFSSVERRRTTVDTLHFDTD